VGKGVGLGGMVGDGVEVGIGVQVGGSSDNAVARGGKTVADNCGWGAGGKVNPQLEDINTTKEVITGIKNLFLDLPISILFEFLPISLLAPCRGIVPAGSF
jgi:hypothetical protein